MSTPAHDLSRLRIDRSAQPSHANGRRWIIVTAVAVVAIAAAAFAFLRGESLAVEVVTATPLDAGTGPAANTGSVSVTANGYVVARTRAAVSAKIAGRLILLNVSEGSQVRAGTLIAQLENADYIASVEEARANIASARAQHAEAEADQIQADREADRIRRIRADNPNLTAQQELDAAESRATITAARVRSAAARIEATQASLRFAEAMLENTYIRAPFTGTVLRKEAEVGEVVAPSVGGGLTRGAVVTMADLTTLEVEVDVNEAYIGRVTRGQVGRITLEAYPDTSFRGEVRQVVPTADRTRATVQVKVAIRDRDPRILPEMGARVDFIAAEPVGAAAQPAVAGAPRFRLPQEAVRSAGAETVVWIVRDGRLESRKVEAGPVSAGFREIRSGLLGGEQVLLRGVSVPSIGQRVHVGSNQ